jgi:predicted DNA-binding protein
VSPKVKTEKFPAVRVSPKLKAETEMFSEDTQETLSEYIRKAVEQRNERYRVNVDIGNRAIEWASKRID